ncbi:MAG TPA: molybdate ABC transporter substrate-binding protein, partial [Candidatus Acidoferrum sp.]|nr:molybdate ABC transporter substrate-binding protein [Candidatus Acidoferrum sp.]
MPKANYNSTRPCCGRLLVTLAREGRRALFLFSFFLCSGVGAQTLRVAAASDLQFVLPDLAAQYEKQTGAKLAITYGSSGNFFAQIQNGAPFDLFFSADNAYPRKLAEAGFADANSLVI